MTDAVPSTAAPISERRPQSDPANGRIRALIGATVWAVLLAGVLSTAFATSFYLLQCRDVGYPDSAALLRIADVAHGRALYPSLDQPPYLATLYGPLFYLSLAIPFRLAELVGADPTIAVRATIAGACGGCLGLVFVISHRVSGSRRAALMSALAAAAIVPIGRWTTQIRADFPALFLALASIYLGGVDRGGAPRRVAAALAAGLALLCKQTFVAAPIAIICWLLHGRRYGDAVRWALSVVAIVAVGYGITWWHEPVMLAHLNALGHPIWEFRGALRITIIAVSQLAVPFALVGLLAVRGARDPRVELSLLYCAVAWLIALVTIPQVGGNINYFWEPLFASAVLAGAALVAIARPDSRVPPPTAATLWVLLFWAFAPAVRDSYVSIHGTMGRARNATLGNERWRKFIAVISRHHVLSTLPDVTVHGIDPEVPDPFLNTFLDLRGAWHFTPVIAELVAGRFDAVVVGAGQHDVQTGASYRGLPLWNSEMWAVAGRYYAPACTLDGDEVWLPRGRPSGIRGEFISSGCVPVVDAANAANAAP